MNVPIKVDCNVDGCRQQEEGPTFEEAITRLARHVREKHPELQPKIMRSILKYETETFP